MHTGPDVVVNAVLADLVDPSAIRGRLLGWMSRVPYQCDSDTEPQYRKLDKFAFVKYQ